MNEGPEVPGSPRNVGQAPQGASDREERRLVAAAVRLLMKLPRAARWALLVGALAGGAEVTGGVDAVLEALLAPEPVEVPAEPSRSHRPELRLERADAEALDVER